jgi:hypothetical protein
MPRTLLGFTALAMLALPCRADQPSATPETLIRLEVSPAPSPKPALRYRLLPELHEMNPGNPVQGYLKCFMERQKFLFDKESFQRREKLLVMPLKDLPAQELRYYGGFALRQADRAARLDNPDWQILLKLKVEGVALLLPDIQAFRPLVRALEMRFRAEIALRRFDDAIGTAKTMFALSRHLGEHPTLIASLVGFFTVNAAIGPLEEMLEQPGCPNLYWALTNLPHPLVPLDKGMDGERVTVLAEFRDLDDRSPMSADQLKGFIAHCDELLGDGTPARPGESRVHAWLDARTKDESKVSAARHRLGEHGVPEERLVRFPAEQVILLDEKREYDVRFEDIMKTTTLPAWQAEALMARSRSAREPALLADSLVEGVYDIRRKQARPEQRIALLRHVEALRLYAAEHDGALPASLSEVAVPLPEDPFTGKPFRYEVSGNTAHLRGSPPAGEEKNPEFNIHYEVTLQK